LPVLHDAPFERGKILFGIDGVEHEEIVL
jgi:hypothetical protein